MKGTVLKACLNTGRQASSGVSRPADILVKENKADRRNIMKRFVLTSGLLTPALLLLLTFFAAKSASATTYYVSTSGADTNNGTSKTTPWAHVPGMPSATGTAGSHVSVAGDTIILRGCDVWYNTPGTSNFPLEFTHGGSSGNPVTITVDQTWYNTTACPNAWNRPVFDGHASSSSSTPTQIGGSTSGCVGGNGNYFVMFSASYITLDFIELRNLYYANDAENSCYGGNGWFHVSSADYVTVSNSYEHDWKMGPYHAGSVDDADELVLIDGSPLCPHCLMTHNVANNCASTSGSGTQPGGALSFVNVTYSIYKCLSNAYKPIMAGEFGWNEITLNGESPDPTIHANCIETLDSLGNGGVYHIHDNRLHDNYDCEEMQIGNPGETDYVWNNVIYTPGPGANGPEVPQSETPVAFYFWNNTIVDSDGCIHDAAHGYSWSKAFYSQNNLCIGPTNSNSSGSPSASPVVISNNLGMTDAQATSAGFSTSAAIPFSPTSSSAVTVGAGANLASVWPAGYAMQDANLICTQQTVNTVVESVCTGTPIPRPASGAWDVGAYQFSAVSSAKPNPPTNVKATVQ
jgi:hypothetical protein